MLGFGLGGSAALDMPMLSMADAHQANPFSGLKFTDEVLRRKLSTAAHVLDRYAGTNALSASMEKAGDLTAPGRVFTANKYLGASATSYFYKFAFGAFAWTLASWLVSESALAPICFRSDCTDRLWPNLLMGLAGSLGACVGFALWTCFHFRQKVSDFIFTEVNLFGLVVLPDALWQSAYQYPLDKFGDDVKGILMQPVFYAVNVALGFILYRGATALLGVSEQRRIPLTFELGAAFVTGGSGFGLGSALSGHHWYAPLINALVSGAAALLPPMLSWRAKQGELEALFLKLADMYDQSLEAQQSPAVPHAHVVQMPAVGPTADQILQYLEYTIANLSCLDRNEALYCFRQVCQDKKLTQALSRRINQDFTRRINQDFMRSQQSGENEAHTMLGDFLLKNPPHEAYFSAIQKTIKAGRHGAQSQAAVGFTRVRPATSEVVRHRFQTLLQRGPVKAKLTALRFFSRHIQRQERVVGRVAVNGAGVPMGHPCD